MKIRVTLIFLMCTSIIVASDPQISTNINLSKKGNLVRRFVPRHRIYEYSRSMEPVNVDLKDENGGIENQITEPVYNSETVNVEALPNGSGGRMSVESGKSSQQMFTVRMNSKQPSQIFEVGTQPQGNEVLSREKKDRMEQAMMALLMAYKMKFTALIPIMLGGLSLLVSTTALAGFFFALFAAVLGLKAH